MRRRPWLTFVLVIALPGGVMAQPASLSPIDPRIRIVDYNPWTVTALTGVFRTATQVLFGDDETILHVALGDATGWDVVADRNTLFIKPKAARAPTNLIVTTRRQGTTGQGERHYMFALRARADAERPAASDTVFALRFRYPADVQVVASGTARAEAAALQAKVLQLKLDRAVLEGPRNLAYSLQGDVSLQPSEISDNGRFTVLRFPGSQPVPTLYEVTASGEAVVPFDVRGEFVVVHAVVRELRLRRGREVLCLYNDAFQPYGTANATGTAAQDVQRTDKAEARP